MKSNVKLDGAHDLSFQRATAAAGGVVAIGTAILRDSNGNISGTFATNLLIAEAVAGAYNGSHFHIVLSDGITLTSTSMYVNCANKLIIDGAVGNNPKLGSGTFQLVQH